MVYSKLENAQLTLFTSSVTELYREHGNMTRVLTVLLEPGYGTILESRCGITLFVIKRRVWVTTETRDGQAERLLNTTILQ